MKDYRVIQIEKNIIEGDFKTALQSLLKSFELLKSDFVNDTLLFLGQFNTIERDVQQGIIPKINPESMRIQKSIVALKDELQSIFESSGQVITQAPADQPIAVLADRFTYIHEDNFTENVNGWYETEQPLDKNTDSVKYYFKDNQYIIDSTIADDEIQYVGSLFVLDPDVDFKIEMTIETYSINEGSYYGLIWGCNPETSDLHSISINAAGNVCVDSLDNTKGTYTAHLGWSYFEHVNEGKGVNILAIESSKQKLKFYVNGKLVHINPFLPFYGNVIGVVFSNIFKIGIKHLRIGIA